MNFTCRNSQVHSCVEPVEEEGLTESLRMLRKVLRNRMLNWVMQLAEKLWQPSDEELSWRTETLRICSDSC